MNPKEKMLEIIKINKQVAENLNKPTHQKMILKTCEKVQRYLISKPWYIKKEQQLISAAAFFDTSNSKLK